MEIIKFFAEVLLVIAGLRFVKFLYKKFTNAETMEAVFNAGGKKIKKSKKELTGYLKNKVDTYKAKKEQEKDIKPTIIIR